MAADDSSSRVLVLAPIGRDSELLAQTALSRGIEAAAFTRMREFLVAFQEGCGVVLLTEEALHEDSEALRAAVAEQPPWSEIPFIVLTSRGVADERVRLTLELMQPLRNATVIERPVRPATVLAAIEAALRDRRRQYEVRDVLHNLRAANEDLERKVAARTADLAKKVEEMEGFTYSISHDMRAPLRAIIARAHMVLEEEEAQLSEEGKNHLTRLHRAAAQMAQLVEDLLQYARLGNRDLVRDPLSIGDLVRRVAEDVRRDRAEASLELHVECEATVQADSRILGMALHNLLDNACKYRKSGERAYVTFGCETVDGEHRFFLRDAGIGFNMAYVEKLFIPFERLHREEYTGTGIGLANVRRAIERHEGRIWAEGEVGRGATFWFTVPDPK
jgi:signal transduction histidine kinase